MRPLVLARRGTLSRMAVAPPAEFKPWRAPQTITQGGDYFDSWESTSSAPAVTIGTTEPVRLSGRIRNLYGGTLLISNIHGVDVTCEHLWVYGGETYQTSGRFVQFTNPKVVKILNCTIENTRGIEFEEYPAPNGGVAGGSHIEIMRNRHTNIKGYMPQGQNIALGNFIQLRWCQHMNYCEIGWNEIINQPGLSFPEDIISIVWCGINNGYVGAHIFDNYLYHQSATPNECCSSQGGITIDGSTYAEWNVWNNIVERNQIIDGMGPSIWPGSGGSNNKLLNNRVIRIATMDNGQVNANGWREPLWVHSGGSNNHAEGNLVGYIDREGVRADFSATTLAGAAEGGGVEVIKNTHYAGTLDAVARAAEWTFWQEKLAANGITVGA